MTSKGMLDARSGSFLFTRTSSPQILRRTSLLHAACLVLSSTSCQQIPCILVANQNRTVQRKRRCLWDVTTRHHIGDANLCQIQLKICPIITRSLHNNDTTSPGLNSDDFRRRVDRAAIALDDDPALMKCTEICFPAAKPQLIFFQVTHLLTPITVRRSAANDEAHRVDNTTMLRNVNVNQLKASYY